MTHLQGASFHRMKSKILQKTVCFQNCRISKALGLMLETEEIKLSSAAILLGMNLTINVIITRTHSRRLCMGLAGSTKEAV